jgi:Zn-dependent alcohol dehydrogenase
MTTTANSDGRFLRQADLVPAERLRQLEVTVVGVGAVGRPLVLMLAALGVSRLRLYDADTVEDHNMASQGYGVADVGRPKVESVRDAVRAFDPGVDVTAVRDVFRRHHASGDVVFCCVDSIATRAVLWKALAARASFWGDARMLGVLAAGDEASRRHYPTTLFAQAEAQAGRCTSRSTLFGASITAGLLVHQFARWLRDVPVDPDVTLNLLAGELTHAVVP